MRGWQNSFSARLRRTQWALERGLSVLSPGQPICPPTRRFKIQTFPKPPAIGWGETKDWFFDEAEAHRLAQASLASGKYRAVKIASMRKINGRWTRYSVEEIFSAGSVSPIQPSARPGDSNGEASVSKLPAAASPSAAGALPERDSVSRSNSTSPTGDRTAAGHRPALRADSTAAAGTAALRPKLGLRYER